MRFKDDQGREYDCVITLQTVIDLQEIGVDLNDLFDGDLLQRLQDPKLLVATLYLAVEESVQAHGLDCNGFARALGGDTLESAKNSLMEAFVSFSPPSVRTALRNLLSKSREVSELATQQWNQAINELSPETILKSCVSAGSKPESSGSTPADSPCVSSVG